MNEERWTGNVERGGMWTWYGDMQMTEASDYGVDESVPMEADEPSPMQIEIYRRMTPEERLLAGVTLTRAMRRLKRAGIQAQHPDWTWRQVEEALIRAFLYAGD